MNSTPLVCVKRNCSFRTCHSESVINNVLTCTSAQEQVCLVKPSDTIINTSQSKNTNILLNYAIII